MAVAPITDELGNFPGVVAQTGDEFATAQLAWIDDLLGILYALLAISVIVSLFGIVNTMALAVLERTRELGSLRASGMSRRQMRRMIRHESVITALIGATIGTIAGLAIAGAVTLAFAADGLTFAVPAGSLIGFAIAAVIAGIVAGALPARRAARLQPLAALHHE